MASKRDAAAMDAGGSDVEIGDAAVENPGLADLFKLCQGTRQCVKNVQKDVKEAKVMATEAKTEAAAARADAAEALKVAREALTASKADTATLASSAGGTTTAAGMAKSEVFRASFVEIKRYSEFDDFGRPTDKSCMLGAEVRQYLEELRTLLEQKEVDKVDWDVQF